MEHSAEHDPKGFWVINAILTAQCQPSPPTHQPHPARAGSQKALRLMKTLPENAARGQIHGNTGVRRHTACHNASDGGVPSVRRPYGQAESLQRDVYPLSR
ncbi:hypothetical protein SKAU_G00035310 [Synaphobranchus kaupii]|uniref:Uncharacterized protein n=1 Tax=Synaphobranchus kaupii TaxID=118154 RepID=A0A9Q1JEN7_SYNKA|nr:hypothetical protein SKAU_G00035310 [Synaphobranchus kaupii]